jgi:putative CocE/NonD family hydrolase
MNRVITAYLLFILFAGSLWGSDVDLLWGVRIPMRDGVNLNATVWKPADSMDPLPVIFTLTPYISDSYHMRAYYFAQNGYVYATVDVRGRGNSEGAFEPLANEARDGHDIVEWFAQQPWCNGKVTMWGGSYAGFDQWSTAKEFPPHLITIVPAAAAHPGIDIPSISNIFYPYVMQWLTLTSGVTPNTNLFGESSFWIQKFRKLYLEHIPFRRLDSIIGNTSTHFQTLLFHPTYDEYWAAMVPTPEDYAKMALPILTITGSYDADQLGAMQYYRMHMKYGSPEGKSKHYIIIGPWDHAGTRTPKKEFGGCKFGDASLLDMNKLHLEWYDWTMKDGPKPEFLKNRAAYYVMGAEEWKYADSLEAITASKQKLYLNSTDGRANDVFASGLLSKQTPDKSKPDSFIYDPLDVRPAELEKEEVQNIITDQRHALSLFGNGVVYHTIAFTEDTEVSGFPRMTAWISIDVPDTDFHVTLSEILPDGTSILLSQALLRARYRESLSAAKPVKPGEITRYDFNGFTFFSRRIGKGSRLRLVLSCPNSINLQKNYNSGGAIADETAKDARTAYIMIYHDARYPSTLELPLAE